MTDTGPAALETALTAARTLIEQGRFDVAERTLEQTRKWFPDRPEALIEYARVAETKHDWVVMATRCTVLRIRFPDEIHGYRGGARALRELERLDEADALLEAAMSRFPNEPDVFIDHLRAGRRSPQVTGAPWRNASPRFASVSRTMRLAIPVAPRA